MEKEKGVGIDLNVLEGMDDAQGSAALVRFVVEKGYAGYEFDEEGNVSVFAPRAEVAADPESPSGP